MLPGQYHVPGQVMHPGPGRRQHSHTQQQDYYQGYQNHGAVYGYAGQHQQPYPFQHAPYAQQWYPQHYQQHPMAYRQYPQYQHHPSHQAPMVVSSHVQHQAPFQNFQRPPYASPVAAAAPPTIPLTSTPVSTQSYDTPASSTPNPTNSSPTSVSTTLATSTVSISQTELSVSSTTTTRTPFYPKLPWTSVPESDFPPRSRRRKRRQKLTTAVDSTVPEATPTQPLSNSDPVSVIHNSQLGVTIPALSSTVSPLSADDDNASNGATSKTIEASSVVSIKGSSVVKPVIPTKPVIPSISQPPPVELASSIGKHADRDVPEEEPDVSVESSVAEPANAKSTPKSWADLVRSKGQPKSGPLATSSEAQAEASSLTSKASSLADAIRSFDVSHPSRFAFLEPRGLVNTGNMCYMNSILQVLVFCIPFFDFLSQVGQKAAHSFKSETPLLDAMILIAREFNVIDAAESASKLCMRLKDNELEQYGDSFIPEYVYDVIKRLPRFSSMRRGHQQDAEEFMGFLLEGLHDECVSILQRSQVPEDSQPEPPAGEHTANGDGGWHEVGPRQRAAVTRSSGNLVAESPIAKIFGGKIRSELRVPGLKNSVTMEPYQALQLDIGSSSVFNIIDALKGLTRPETLHGDFNSPRGPGTTATKQIFIESLPPVLILHLKRFQYDNTGGVQKIWRRVGYPLELSMPKEVFSPSKRSALTLSGIPKYRLNAVVYHHGKNASGGHYTVDIRRQDGNEWIRLDDTNIRRVRAEDVASAGAEEDPKVLAKALEAHRNEQAKKGANIYDSFGDAEEEAEEHNDWNQVNGSSGKDLPAATRKWAAVANGSPTPSSTGKRTPKWEQIKDNKVAYILFYRKID